MGETETGGEEKWEERARGAIREGETRASEGKGRGRGHPGTQKKKTRRPKGTQREGCGAFAQRKVSSPPRPSSALRGPAPSRAPRGPARPRASLQERGPMGPVGPAPSRADWPLPPGSLLINKFSGEQRPTWSRLVRPGARPARRRQRVARPRAPEPAFWGGAGGARARARPARAPGAPRSRPRSQPAPSPCPAAGPCCGWRWGPALHGPGC